MKTKILILAFIILFSYVEMSFAQAEQDPQLFLIEEFQIAPSGAADFKAVFKEYGQDFKKHNIQVTWNTYSASGGKFYILFPVENYAAMKDLFATLGEYIEKAGKERFDALHEREFKHVQSIKMSLYHYLPQLSYIPENPRLKPEDAPYQKIVWWHVRYDKIDEWDNIINEWKVFYKSKDIAEPFATWKAHIGAEYNVYILIWSAKNAIDYHEMNAEIWKKMGDEGRELYKRTMELVEKVEEESCWYRPEMSYTSTNAAK